MWIQVRSMDGKRSEHINALSKLSKIEDLRRILATLFDAPPERQRLFYRGKQMEDGHTLFDYKVGLNDIVQLMIRSEDVIRTPDDKSDGTSSGYESSCSTNMEDEGFHEQNKKTSSKELTVDDEVSKSEHYKVGDMIDAKDNESGAWFEAKITKIIKTRFSESSSEKNNNCGMKYPKSSSSKNTSPEAMQFSTHDGCLHCDDDDGYGYYVLYDGYEDEDPVKLKYKHIRPRAHTMVKFEDLKIGDLVMVNYNIDDPQERGFWFDACVTNVTLKELTVTILVGMEDTPLVNCKVNLINEIYHIDPPIKLTQRTEEMETLLQKTPPPKRQYKPACNYCKDNPRRKCKHCACCACGEKNNPSKQILCDECDSAYHLWCLDPPLEEVPSDEEWYCPSCKIDASEVVRAGEKLKDSKKKAKMPSSLSTCNRDWGKGMACVGRTKECTIVPPNHFGPIPGVEVGTIWKFRVQVSESGVHRPHVAGIHGRETEGAYSIVLAGGYEDDVDDGDEFTYTGSGGRDLSGNKRTAIQSSDQTLTRMNRALALNCYAPLTDKGTESVEWRKGKPVRVVRSFKGLKYSSYCPPDGNRYDGIYKIVKYWPEKGKSGYLVWRYLLRRDDPNPAPWTKAGQKRNKELGLVIQYPAGYLEAKNDKDEHSSPKGQKVNSKRPLTDNTGTPSKKKKSLSSLSTEVKELIKKDVQNQHLWDDCLKNLDEGMQKFVSSVEELFMCICCQEVVFKPITTICRHNICEPCLSRSFKANVYTCPACRRDLGKNYSIVMNSTLRKILQVVLPGYENGR